MLRHLAAQPLPIAITCADEVDAVQVLMLAGHLEATLAPPAGRRDGGRSRTATVHGVTRLGHWMLRQFPPAPATPISGESRLLIKKH